MSPDRNTIKSIADCIALVVQLKNEWFPHERTWAPWFRGQAEAGWKLTPAPTRQCEPVRNVGHRASITSAQYYSKCLNGSANGMKSSTSTRRCDCWTGVRGASCLQKRGPGYSRCRLAKRTGRAPFCSRSNGGLPGHCFLGTTVNKNPCSTPFNRPEPTICVLSLMPVALTNCQL